MNNENFMTWVQKQLLPNLPERSVLVIDNAAYHNVPIKKNITMGCKKEEMLNWLVRKGVTSRSQTNETRVIPNNSRE